MRVRVTGVGAAAGEVLAPIAARVRHALGLDDGGRRLRGTSAFEDALVALLDEVAASPRARSAVLAHGRRCPVAPRLRTVPTPQALLAATGTLSDVSLARRCQALARAFVAVTPCPASRS